MLARIRVLCPLMGLACLLLMCSLARAGDGPDPDQPPPSTQPDGHYLYDVPMSKMDEERADPPGVPANQDTESFFTFYDVYGYIPGTAQGPSGWVASSSLTGLTPTGAVVSDNPNVPNIIFTYVGPGSIVGPAELGDFTFESAFNTTTTGMFSDQDFSSITSAREFLTGSVTLPIPKPTSLSVLGVSALVLLRRRWKFTRLR
jgi:hypothetical protein